MLHSGVNVVGGVEVSVVRKRIRRINLSVARDGKVSLSVPFWGATLRDAEEFMRSKWAWVLKARAKALSRPQAPAGEPGAEEKERLAGLLERLNRAWCGRMGLERVEWRLRRMKSLWGSCHWREKKVVYNSDLARAPEELVEYVVVHELTHFFHHDHGPGFKAAMDARLPGWRSLRARLNRRAGFASPAPVQAEFDFGA